MTDAPRRAFVVSHTHWDREWYLSYGEFRVNLSRVVGKVLDALESDPDFAHFVLDGQAIALEDHVQARPGDAARIEAVRTHAVAAESRVGDRRRRRIGDGERGGSEGECEQGGEGKHGAAGSR